MSTSNFASVCSVLSVTDHSAAVEWYQRWIGRAPDIEPIEGIAEWQLADNAWIQVSVDPDSSGKSVVVVGVNDVSAQCDACSSAGVDVGEIQDYGFIKLAEAVDPAGNKINFVEEFK